MKKRIHRVGIDGSNLMELRDAINDLLAARVLESGNAATMEGQHSDVHVENGDGYAMSSLELIEETLSDSSKAYTVVINFNT